jgi:phytoene/squalene synthetase
LDAEQRTALRATVAQEVRRARELLAHGAPLAASLPLRARLAVSAFSAGGAAALDSIERAGFDVVAHRCRPRRARFFVRWLSVLAPRRGARL